MTLQSPNEALQPELPPPPPPRKRRPTLSAFSGFLSFLLLLSIGGFFGVIWGMQRLKEPGPLAADKVLYIAPGTDFPDVVAQLEAERVIDNGLIFNVAVVAEGKRSKIKAGEYLFKQSASMRDVIAILVSGRQVLHSVTIPEGLTSEQIVDRLRHNDLLQGEILEIPKEGSLLPETYKVPRNMSRSELISRMQEDEKKLVAQIWAHRASDLILRSPYELVTLASIVEKETGKADERPRVAAVFLNRLRKHMRLQSDPTIVYGLVGGKGTLGRPILRSEVERPTPYNTYVIEGLPPTPIDNPGRAALEAVANPSHTQELYFVADGTGGHVFSTTLEQHVRNVKRWRLIEKEAKEKSGTDVDHVLPQPPTTGRSHQRGELDTPSIYGALPSSFDAPGGGRTLSLGMGNGALAMAALGPQLPKAIATAVGKPLRGRHRRAARTSASEFEMAPGLDQLGITVRGVTDSKVASALLDGPIDASQAAAVAPQQVASSQPQPESADPATQSASLTFIPGGEPPPASEPGNVQPQQQAERPVQQGGAPVHPAIYDASEGTPLDPLRDKTYDLNYAKTVPTTASLQ
ncbi:MAG: endolytic transglycosylase MltG [Beijerinckiaceae bacterium]|nr:MAG: endolytic transglycosylase MltG [Beijerinckiaceae bacterium]